MRFYSIYTVLCHEDQTQVPRIRGSAPCWEAGKGAGAEKGIYPITLPTLEQAKRTVGG